MIHFLTQVAHWFTTAEHWRGVDGIPHRTLQHVVMSGTAAATAAAIALPVGIGLGHVGRGGVLAANLSNFEQGAYGALGCSIEDASANALRTLAAQIRPAA